MLLHFNDFDTAASVMYEKNHRDGKEHPFDGDLVVMAKVKGEYLLLHLVDAIINHLDYIWK